MNKKDEILRMLKGEDDVGIVPEHVTPRDRHGMFPAEDRNNDFLNPWHDPELAAVIKNKAV